MTSSFRHETDEGIREKESIMQTPGEKKWEISNKKSSVKVPSKLNKSIKSRAEAFKCSAMRLKTGTVLQKVEEKGNSEL